MNRLQQRLHWIFLGKRKQLSEKIILRCPRCNSKLDKHQKEDIIIDVCPSCNGMWLDDGEIDKLNTIGQKQRGKHGKKE